MSDINPKIVEKLSKFDKPISSIGQLIVSSAQTRPEKALVEELKTIINKEVKRMEKDQ